MSQVYVITSGKGGVGKSTITANLARKLSSHNVMTLVIDMDIGLRNLDVIMGLDHKVIYHIYDVLEDRCSISKALVQENEYLYLLPAAWSKNKKDIDSGKFYTLLELLRQYFQIILIDCPAGIDYGFELSCRYSDEAIMVVNPIVTSIRDSDKILSILNDYSVTSNKLIINMYRKDNRNVSITQNDIERILGYSNSYLFPYDDDVIGCGNRGFSIFRNNKMLINEYERLCKDILSEHKYVED